MAGADHNPTRRALLGAAFAAPLLPLDGGGQGGGGLGDGALRLRVSTRADRHPHPASPIEGEEWNAALTAFHAAREEVRRVEAATAGASMEEEEEHLPAHDAACAAMGDALERLLGMPAPDLPAFAVKLELLFAHAVEPGAVDEEMVEAALGDVRRLAFS